MYNMIFGTHPNAGYLLANLDLDPGKIPRLRDCYMIGDEIAVLTRTGGGNREIYDGPDVEGESRNRYLREHPLFVRDEDDTLDSTYAYFYFKVPEEIKAQVEENKEYLVGELLSVKFPRAMEEMKAMSDKDLGIAPQEEEESKDDAQT